ncbi:hypothetical protein KQ940_18845 [Marinobacterium sp. D7]|uniref:pilus assembly protein n=1 Tax=Marinobacterium ramblicola TaxID=2849041 RepID=UPI001C2D1053|nr:PilC/PilY family type IV pilus protein [Marinobacterium ramblicola]MBV1790119.1 hypothetical protein [Marinobacterium ramblicola]
MKRWLVYLTLPFALLGTDTSSATVSQEPLFLGGSVPGNLAIVPSVEWPTINSVANLGAFDPDKTYVGYFDSFKCYDYEGSDTESERHFVPKTKTTDRLCDGSNSGYWSGNFLNWATTQTIDPFRKALTGGLRAKDTAQETWLEKAWDDGSAYFVTDRTVSRNDIGSTVDKLLPFDFDVSSFTVQRKGLGKQILFSFSVEDSGSSSVDSDYIPNGTGSYFASVRVEVCVEGLQEDNCTQYTDSEGNSVWKPEGLLQAYSDKIRYSVFGYLNDSDPGRDGGVLRARQKFIGPMTRHPTLGWVDNVIDTDSGRYTGMEWDPETGILYDNPDSIDTSATASAYGVTISHSGVINYINKFEELLTDQDEYTFKSYDPVSELYYAATRYFRGLAEVDSYSSFTPSYYSSPDNVTKEKWADGFPIITGWTDADDSKDPIQYSCQKNAILGIGDVNTWNDRNLPGNSYGATAPSDADINVASLLAKVESLEGIDFSETDWRTNSGYIAGLALDIHTRDIRTDDEFDGSQTVETYWVDVVEDQVLMDRSLNQYWLATKYGGFDPVCPGGGSSCITGPYDDDLSNMTDTWWHTNGETLTATWSNASLKKPDNYFTAGNAGDMVDSLKKAFAQISDSLNSTSTSLAFDSRTLRTGSQLFQATFDSTRWSGDLLSSETTIDISEQGTQTVNFTQLWSAADILDALSNVDNRNIFTAGDFTDQTDGSKVTRTARNFMWDQLTDTQKAALKSTSDGTGVSDAEGTKRLNFLRGARDNEQTASDTSKPFRQRDSRLGDIVNSDPQYIYQTNFGYERLSANAQFTSPPDTDVGAAYTNYRSSDTYRNKKPLIVVGANDGMLHGFNANDNKTAEGGPAAEGGGTELFAYMPVSVMDQLYKLTETDYEHQYYVDGTPRLGDAWLGETEGWHTLAVATTGAGVGSNAKGSVFALDISNPDSVTSNSLLWEYTNPLMGKLVQQPALVALANSTFGVVVTSGYDAPQSNGYVWILDAADGSPIKQFELPDTGGLGTPLVVDLDRNRVADRIYVADLSGNVWRIDIADTDSDNWAVPFTTKVRGSDIPIPLFTATDGSDTPARQPITAPLAAMFNSNDKLTLFFGTGSYFQTNDEIVPPTPQVQTFYAIFDEGSVVARDELRQQEITSEQQVGETGTWARVITDNPITSTDSGWYIDLLWSDTHGGPGALGERVTSKANINGDELFFNTLIPSSDPCSGGGISWIMGVDMSNGGRSSDNLFDTNGDGRVDTHTNDENDQDAVPTTETDAQGNQQDTKVVTSGMKSEGVATPTTIESTLTGERWVCFAESNDTQPKCVLVSGFTNIGRVSWRELTEQ